MHKVTMWVTKGYQSLHLFGLLTTLQEKMVPSSDLVKTGQAAVAVRTYHMATQRVAIILAELFKAAFPGYFQKYCKAF